MAVSRGLGSYSRGRGAEESCIVTVVASSPWHRVVADKSWRRGRGVAAHENNKYIFVLASYHHLS